MAEFPSRALKDSDLDSYSRACRSSRMELAAACAN